MKIDCRSVAGAAGEKIPFDYPLDLSRVEWQGEYPFPQPAHVVGQLENRLGMLELTARVSATLHTSCSRCLSPVTVPLEAQVKNILSRDVENEDNDEIILLENDWLELDEVMVPALLLEIDMTYLCRPECQGLCPSCGANLNEGPCQCQKSPVDERMAVLQQWLDKQQ